jgi:hypothetical protein
LDTARWIRSEREGRIGSWGSWDDMADSLSALRPEVDHILPGSRFGLADTMDDRAAASAPSKFRRRQREEKAHETHAEPGNAALARPPPVGTGRRRGLRCLHLHQLLQWSSHLRDLRGAMRKQALLKTLFLKSRGCQPLSEKG